jgi:hypothetical protein
MRLLDWKTCAGLLVVLATLALSLPGVRVARAADEVALISVDLVDSAPSCDAAADPAAANSVQVLLKDDSERPLGELPVALNTQGYSYRPPAVDPEARRLEQR